jgi:hypothetical protein
VSKHDYKHIALARHLSAGCVQLCVAVKQQLSELLYLLALLPVISGAFQKTSRPILERPYSIAPRRQQSLGLVAYSARDTGHCGSVFAYFRAAATPVPTPLAVFFVGFVGGFVGLQRRLKTLPAGDLILLGRSWVCIVISPIAGAILAELLYLLFISGLLAGNIFPLFVADVQSASSEGLKTLFQVHCPDAANYAKVLFWSFVAGFSEKFATNIIRQFEPGEQGPQKPAN